jgi:NAD(P)-dependent dehydrogenase (short-subunit alcohol dehydrogenase family)
MCQSFWYCSISKWVWKDVQIRFKGFGTNDRPITLRAESVGKVTIEGRSNHDTFTNDQVRTNVAAATSLKREGEAKEVADLVSYLASDESSFLTGNNVDINGGLAFS